jgi:transposase-like protein
MPKPYSNDLRERVVKAVEAGQSCRSAALRFGVSPSSAIKWMERWRQHGDVSPGSSRGRDPECIGLRAMRGKKRKPRKGGSLGRVSFSHSNPTQAGSP